MGGLKTLDNNTLKSLGRFNKTSFSNTGTPGGSATLTEQQAQTTLLAQILAESDYEHTVTLGRDTYTYTPLSIQNGLFTQYQGGISTPPITTLAPAYEFTISNSGNNNYYVEFSLGTFSVRNNVILALDYIIDSCDAGTGDITFEYYGDNNLLSTIPIVTGASTGDTGTYSFNYDNSFNGYTTFKIFVYQSDTSGNISATYENTTIIDASVSSNFTTNTIKKVESFLNGVSTAINYFDYLDNPYTLVDTFIPDARLESTYLERLSSEFLDSLNSNTIDIAADVRLTRQYVGFENWDKIVGNSTEYTYTPSTLVPTNFLVASIIYKTGATTILTRTFAYNASDNLISITAS